MLELDEFTKQFQLAFQQIINMELPYDPSMLLESYSQIEEQQQVRIDEFLCKNLSLSAVQLMQYFTNTYKVTYSPPWPQEIKTQVLQLVKKNNNLLNFQQLCCHIIAKLKLEDNKLYNLQEIKLLIQRNIKPNDHGQKSQADGVKTAKHQISISEEAQDQQLSDQECFQLLRTDATQLLQEIGSLNHPLIQQIKQGSVQKVQEHAQSTSRIVFYNTVTPLHLAVFFDQFALVKLLTDKYARIQAIQCYTALTLAVIFDRREIFDFLVPFEHSTVVINQHSFLNFVPPKSTQYFIAQFSANAYYANQLVPFEHSFSCFISKAVEDKLLLKISPKRKENKFDLVSFKTLEYEKQIEYQAFSRGWDFIPQSKAVPYLQQQILNYQNPSLIDTQFRIYSPKGVTNMTLAVLTFDLKLVQQLVSYESGMANFGGIWNQFKIPKGSTASDIADGIIELLEDKDPNIKDFLCQFGDITEGLIQQKHQVMKNIVATLKSSVDILVDLNFIKEKLFQNVYKQSLVNKLCDPQLFYADSNYTKSNNKITQNQIKYAKLLLKFWNHGEINQPQISIAQEPVQKAISSPEQPKPSKKHAKQTVSQTDKRPVELEKQSTPTSQANEAAIAEIINQTNLQIEHTISSESTPINDDNVTLEISYLITLIGQLEVSYLQNNPELSKQESKQKLNSVQRENQILENFAKLQEVEIKNLQNELVLLQKQLSK
ncbi:hypothetical protein SS50377_27942 [Spironucleus salmonicida]|uniref:Ankyrin repeat-containing protein n=1 Tax=Spironucleus salmonicida TaxID=348837 RepID=V6LP50_9EUKA|nr:hypothetical protein SS50377_27942 [Spironucleus salmonicida]|eukprot:EST42504.1 hypothetical protein SS50377_17810 [Spironucleus salmonicida]